MDDIDDFDQDICERLSRVLRKRLGVRLFNRLRDRLEHTGVDDRVVTLAVITEMSPLIQSNQPVTVATRNTPGRMQLEVVDWSCITDLENHGRLLDGPLF